MMPSSRFSPAAPPEAGGRVLVVEDHRDSREALRILLEMWGYQVEVAEDGLRGAERALAWQPVAAIVDIGLPILNGYEVARRVRASLGANIRLIALTAYGQPEDRKRALEAGFDVHLVKPVELDTLAFHLRRAPPSAPEPPGGEGPRR
jgi:CheY-like chemotaxis protein